MFGRTTAQAVRHSYHDLVKPGVRFVQTTVRSIDPVRRRAETEAGPFEADVMVVALGADLDPSATPGLAEAGREFYTVDGAFATRGVLDSFGGGRVIVGVTSTPFKCPPARARRLCCCTTTSRNGGCGVPARFRWACRSAPRSRPRPRHRRHCSPHSRSGASTGTRSDWCDAWTRSAGWRSSPTAKRSHSTCSLACPCITHPRSSRNQGCAWTAGSRSTHSPSKPLTRMSTRSVTSPALARPRQESSPNGRHLSSLIS
jgi:hypothetical protein